MKKIKRKPVRVVLTVLIIIAAILLVLLAAAAIAYFHRSGPDAIIQYDTTNPHIVTGTRISAHRAGGGVMPEETLMAFQYCAEDPSFTVDVFELDLHITRDDVLILLHDDELDRVSDSELIFGETGVRPENKTYEELRRLNMGAKFETDAGETPYASLHGGAVPDALRILSLDGMFDYLTSVGDFDYIIEIKNGGDLGKHALDILYQTIKDRGLLDHVIFGTFHGEVSDYKDETYPDLMRGAYAGEVLDFYLAAITNRADYVPPCGALQLPFGSHSTASTRGVNLATATVINYAHAHDMAVQYWTINDEADMAYLLSLGADCVMTDYPNVLYGVMHGN